MFSLADVQQAEAGPYAADLDGYRRALRSWLAGADLDRWRGLHRSDVPTTMREHAQLVRLLHEQGFGRYGHPAEAGGLGGDVRHSAVLYDELSAHDLPVPEQYVLLCVLGPPLVRFAPAIASQLLPGFLRGDQWWGQGFSEPEAGSDLASLRTRATKVDGGYVLSGQKLWTSHGSTAARIVVLARTGTPESRHRGLSMLLVDADSPGVTVRPVLLANGRAELAECFFDDVAVPASRLIGTEGQGWAVAMYLLQFERALYAWLRSGHLMQLLRSLAAQATSTDEAHRALGECYLDLIALRSRSLLTVRRLAAGETVGPEASADKILLGTAEQSVLDAARDLIESDFALGGSPDVERWRDEWWYSRTTTVYGGSAEVQRGIIADRVLNLPKEAT